MSKQIVVVLDTIRSAYNVGAIFRTCDGAGVESVWLTGYTPAPIDRFGRPQAEITKTSLGASTAVPWTQFEEIALLAALAAKQADGYTVVVVEQTKSAIMLPEWSAPERCVYIFGNEVDGVSAPLRAAADVHVELPMLGTKESLNVSVTAGIVLYH